jgi:hypothetical protein
MGYREPLFIFTFLQNMKNSKMIENIQPPIAKTNRIEKIQGR